MPPRILVSTSSAIPPYEQIRSQLAGLISDGVLAADERLPPVRQLAADLGLAAGTIARAYRELEQAGYVVSRRGGGTRVAAAPVRATADLATLAGYADAYVAQARRLGADDELLLDAVRQVLRRPLPD
ncbi:GntR family transcriptional regulator [Crossiella cryophila]|uniref:DNA-binding transcriptional regulator YhcF (GntR family) n=1 Tax=Crossiella cryophila TaxID=43355 RepID=A0A7W7CF39_9PSEU|nr:GntR family transcriptional regulator [Crossiella cryophila]MBB4679935.1 DNA-binding transcriptional regulator YhcF (GntR family) [Crossiella cryophila]